ncbi:GAP family protein [Microbacterium sp. NPDC019599]|uniref:GAP family protein n=1 Tax=Microbacterium sp. NPDC019599 TaxID=3154690 RepID=UPI0033D87692
MSPAALGPAIGAAFGIAISPVSIATVILLLLSPRAGRASLGFVVGWASGIAAAATVGALLSGVEAAGRRHVVLGVFEVVVGFLLLVSACVAWLRGRRAAGRRPALLRLIDRSTFPAAFVVGIVMAINPPNLLLALAGGGAIGSGGLTMAVIVLAIAVFTVVAASTVLIPVLAYFVAAERMRQPLDALRGWLARHDSVIVTTVLLVFGMLLTAHGVATLWAG